MSKKETINSILEPLLGHDLFLVQLQVSEGSNGKVFITLDGDNGISIDQCAAISRELGNQLEEIELFEHKYTLEVSSPGLDQPLLSPRQYKRNIDREIKIQLVEGKEIKGKLSTVVEDGIEVFEIVKKGNKKAKAYNKEVTALKFEDISKTTILVSFN